MTTPDGSVQTPDYDAGGRLVALTLAVRGGAPASTIDAIAYDTLGPVPGHG